MNLAFNFLTFVVLPALFVWLAVDFIQWRTAVRRYRRAQQAKAEAKRIRHAMNAIGAYQSTELNAAALKACIALLNEAVRLSPEKLPTAPHAVGVVNSTATSSAVAGRASAPVQ